MVMYKFLLIFISKRKGAVARDPQAPKVKTFYDAK